LQINKCRKVAYEFNKFIITFVLINTIMVIDAKTSKQCH